MELLLWHWHVWTGEGANWQHCIPCPAEFYNGLVGEYGAIPIIVNLLPKFHMDRLITLITVELLTLLAENGARLSRLLLQPLLQLQAGWRWKVEPSHNNCTMALFLCVRTGPNSELLRAANAEKNVRNVVVFHSGDELIRKAAEQFYERAEGTSPSPPQGLQVACRVSKLRWKATREGGWEWSLVPV